MSRGFSRVVLVGNLGRDPEMRYSQNGTPITNFTIAVNRRRRGTDGNFTDETDWYRISLFRRDAETAAEYLKKGSKVTVHYKMTATSVESKDAPQTKPKVETKTDTKAKTDTKTTK